MQEHWTVTIASTQKGTSRFVTTRLLGAFAKHAFRCGDASRDALGVVED
jgi:hypothetical protein